MRHLSRGGQGQGARGVHQVGPGGGVCGNGKVAAFEEGEMTNGVRYGVAGFQVRRGRMALGCTASDAAR
ncbi:hypothetical protein OHA63_33120 [Streptomyces anulatus]|uniref:hypothetical protein n=1 Tax=Streptomyces anulatus TaxID=1892 RepID=UPI002E31B378|nr:hypothetical protein [Streptomyces anulatus]